MSADVWGMEIVLHPCSTLLVGFCVCSAALWLCGCACAGASLVVSVLQRRAASMRVIIDQTTNVDLGSMLLELSQVCCGGR